MTTLEEIQARADGQHYDGCPCGACQGIRAARPVTHAMQAKHLSGASIGKLVEYEVGKSLETNEIQWSPTAKLDAVWHAEDSVEISVDYDRVHDFADTIDQIGLDPDDWVRITQVAIAEPESAIPPRSAHDPGFQLHQSEV